MINLETLIIDLKGLGLQAGDTVLVHSSYKSLGPVLGGPKTAFDAIIEVIGAEGTLIVPTFNFEFCKGEPFDVRNTPSQMGILTELVRQHPDSHRNMHPIYSFAFLGKYGSELGKLRYKSSYGADSVFEKLRELDGKIMIIGLSYNKSMTFFHHIEEMEGCDYRYLKSFTGTVTDWEGKSYQDTFLMFVRDLDKGVITAVDPMGKVLEDQGAVSKKNIGEATVRLMKANDVYRITSREMKRNPMLLYQISKM